MCASYGLDPRLSDPDGLFAGDAELLATLREWAVANEGQTLVPTGKHRRNLNPVLRAEGDERRLDLAWWGYLVDGEPAKFASINTRAERLASGRGLLPSRAIVPATSWREMAKPSRVWQRFARGGSAVGDSAAGGSAAGDPALLGLAAVTRPGRTADGQEFVCFSIVMQPAAPHLAAVHERMPLLIAPAFADEWLAAGAPTSLIGAAMDASAAVAERIRVTPEQKTSAAPEDDARLF